MQKNAVIMDSLLWNIFDDIRMWSEGEFLDDRLVWIDCIGLHPLCYSTENLRKIGELWGPIIHIDSRIQGVERITGARILIRTKAQNRIDNRIKIMYAHGSCDVWIKEHCGSCACRGINAGLTMDIPSMELMNKDTLKCPLQKSLAISSYDPLTHDRYIGNRDEETRDWVDPMTSNENIEWKDIEPTESHQCSIPSTPMSNNTSSRPRGRPRKNLDCGRIEAKQTWELAQKLGISTDDEEAVLVGLRKSKRILIMEGKGE